MLKMDVSDSSIEGTHYIYIPRLRYIKLQEPSLSKSITAHT